MLLTDDASSDIRFFDELDDPNYDSSNPDQYKARQILTMPVFTNHDLSQRGYDQLGNYPRAIIHLINKKSKEPINPDLNDHDAKLVRDSINFGNEDIEKLEKLSFSIGRCHEIINKVEQLHSMKEISSGI